MEQGIKQMIAGGAMAAAGALSLAGAIHMDHAQHLAVEDFAATNDVPVACTGAVEAHYGRGDRNIGTLSECATVDNRTRALLSGLAIEEVTNTGGEGAGGAIGIIGGLTLVSGAYSVVRKRLDDSHL